MSAVKSFASIDEVLSHLQHLQSVGYQRNGNWSLGQICNHLVQSIDLTTKGPTRFVPRFAQRAFIRVFFLVAPLGKVGGKLGLRMPTTLPQKEPVDDAVGVERFAESARQLSKPCAAHLVGFHLWHCQHHLAFLAAKPEHAVVPSEELTTAP